MGLKAFRRVRRVDVAIAEMDNRLVLCQRRKSRGDGLPQLQRGNAEAGPRISEICLLDRER